MKILLKLTTLLALILGVLSEQAKPTLYQILQIGSDATSDEIKKSFRKLSIKFHPDKHPGENQIHKKYLQIQRAFQILSDVSKRNTYDLWGQQGLQKLSKDPKPKGGDFRTQMPIPLELFYTGGNQVFNFRRGQICKHCKGTGDESASVLKCRHCQGTGKMIRDVRVKDKIKKLELKCKECKGLGIGSQKKCPICHGEKILLKPRDLRFTVEKGMTDGQIVVFKGESQQGFTFYPGDVYLTLRQMGHPFLIRDQNDLKMNLKITLKQAILGFEKPIRHLDGRQVMIVGDYNVQDGQEIILKGEGMPKRGQMGQYGDLRVKISIQFPSQYTQEQLQKIGKICGRQNPDDELL